MQRKIYTIGYAGFQLSDFICALQENRINAVVDVRSFPYSKYYSDYNTDKLKQTLKNHQIVYRLYDKEFGARQNDRSLYNENHQMNFKLFAQSEQFQKGILRLQKGIDSGFTVALMCAEKDPMNCHRAILVGRELSKRGYDVYHIIANRQVMTEYELEMSLVNIYFPQRNQISLFEDGNKSLEVQIEEAFEIQGQKIAYQEKELADE